MMILLYKDLKGRTKAVTHVRFVASFQGGYRVAHGKTKPRYKLVPNIYRIMNDDRVCFHYGQCGDLKCNGKRWCCEGMNQCTDDWGVYRDSNIP